jgi:hypothetical protein
MDLEEKVKVRFIKLEELSARIPFPLTSETVPDWSRWTTSVMNLLEGLFGIDSVYFKRFSDTARDYHAIKEAKGIFTAAKRDFEEGYAFSLRNVTTGEIFGDFINLAKECLGENYKDVAAVLACAALEDALKRFARENGFDVDKKVMQEVINALKSKGLIKGAQKSLLEAMPKIRDYAMHADWHKIKSEDVSGVIGFTERFIIEHFS